MGANNWDICPKCKEQADKDYAELQARAKSSYGSIPAEEYLALQTLADKPLVMDETLEEYYELGIDKDEFYVSYCARCKKCKFNYQFKRVELI